MLVAGKRLYRNSLSFTRETFTFYTMVLHNGYFIAPTPVNHFEKVMFDEQFPVLFRKRILLLLLCFIGCYFTYQANVCVYFFLKIIIVCIHTA